jgi:phage repressor protein C with HTH and peptisase S24 domain
LKCKYIVIFYIKTSISVKKYIKIMGTTERVVQYIEFKGISKYKFCKDLDFSNKFLDNSSNMGTDKACKILHQYPDINPGWLLTGEGSMLKADPSNIDTVFRLKTDNNLQHQSVPLYDIQASASVVALFKDSSTETPADHITIPNLPKCDGAIYVSGDSMYPLLKSGDIIMYKKLANEIDNMFWGEMYLVSLTNDDGDEFVMVKWLHKSELGTDYVKLVSENRHHQPKDFHIKNIKGLALIKASVRINSMY